MSLVNYGFTSNKQDAAVQQETEEELQNSEQLIVNKTKKQQLSKKRKWNDAFTELGFVKDSDENYPSARCVFCQVIYHNSSLGKYSINRKGTETLNILNTKTSRQHFSNNKHDNMLYNSNDSNN